MDFQAVPPPSNYGAPNVFQPQQGGAQQGSALGQGQPGQQQPNQIAAVLQKAKQLLSSGQISPDQYSQIASQYGNQADTLNLGAPQASPGTADTLNLGAGQ